MNNITIEATNISSGLQQLTEEIAKFQNNSSQTGKTQIEVQWNGKRRKVTVILDKSYERNGFVLKIGKNVSAYMCVNINRCTLSEYHMIIGAIKPLGGTSYSEKVEMLTGDDDH